LRKTEDKPGLIDSVGSCFTNENKIGQHALKTIRYKAYAHLKALVDEIREPEVFFGFTKPNRQFLIPIAQ
jgi:hypothetical protein